MREVHRGDSKIIHYLNNLEAYIKEFNYMYHFFSLAASLNSFSRFEKFMLKASISYKIAFRFLLLLYRLSL